MFDDLKLEFPESAFRTPTGNANARYSCIRCKAVKYGPGFSVVVQSMRSGVCRKCATSDEDAHALRTYPVHERIHPVRLERPEKNMRRAAVNALTNQRGPVPQYPCDRCGKEAVGGRQPSALNEAESLCLICKEKELRKLRDQLNKGSR